MSWIACLAGCGQNPAPAGAYPGDVGGAGLMNDRGTRACPPDRPGAEARKIKQKYDAHSIAGQARRLATRLPEAGRP
jgi:hypothetical protein